MKTPKFLDLGSHYIFGLTADENEETIVGKYVDDLGDGWILVDRGDGPAMAINLACVPQIRFFT